MGRTNNALGHTSLSIKSRIFSPNRHTTSSASSILVTLCLAAVIAAASARPRFLAIPIEDIQFISGPSPFNPAHHRVARQANSN
ncbi:hypothetical protein GHT06_020616 [Daphnia sinensis]|uniref:Uncharacterized protein n=1 Tax=Daphnia sinensis TaxID=1820382 RepID=A0AAD5PM75_9CRUS|nr:hypothetical protein GHT06_020616 [Daphnia sinensis]